MIIIHGRKDDKVVELRLDKSYIVAGKFAVRQDISQLDKSGLIDHHLDFKKLDQLDIKTALSTFMSMIEELEQTGWNPDTGKNRFQ